MGLSVCILAIRASLALIVTGTLIPSFALGSIRYSTSPTLVMPYLSIFGSVATLVVMRALWRQSLKSLFLCVLIYVRLLGRGSFMFASSGSLKVSLLSLNLKKTINKFASLFFCHEKNFEIFF